MKKQPNIIVIVSDQHNRNLVGYKDNSYVKTKNLDWLATEGATFTHAYCNSPVCGPSRMSYMTGKYTHQIGNWFNSVPLDPNEKTWASELQSYGISTTLLGKIDAPGKYDNPGFTNCKLSMTRKAYNPYPCTRPVKNMLPSFKRKLSRELLMESGAFSPEKSKNRSFGYNRDCGLYYQDKQVLDWTLEYIREKGNKCSEPWVLHVGFEYPHWPYRCPEEYFEMYYPNNIKIPNDAKFPNDQLHSALLEWQEWNDFGEISEETLRRTIASYYGMITCLDDMIGNIINELKKQNLYDNTYIVYTSDHGDSMGEHGLFFKHCSYDGSVGVPLIISGPGIEKGKVINTPVSLVDMYPTIIDMMGLKWDGERPGNSWLPLARGENQERSQGVFAEWHGTGFRGAWYMLVQGDYKYTWYEFHKPTLFNIKEDPEENINLSESMEYASTIKYFEEQLKRILDPKETSLVAKKSLGLIKEDGTDLTEIQKVNL